MTAPVLRAKLQDLPERPGVYLHRSASGEILYVGKAKSLRSRVRSYFQPGAQHPPRTARLVREIADFETIVTDTEMEALILEANLIKKERPRYNVVLRDDKNFPYLKVSVKGRVSARLPRAQGASRRERLLRPVPPDNWI